jgi:glycosyltransferase involved in cell wall biosynthesis
VKEIRHTVILITYNQENYIEMALRSALEQDTLPFEIIIGDDSSTDDTFNIVLNIQKEYPNIIKLFRHKKNLGVFKNIEFLREKVTGDVVTFLAGDDYLNYGLFTELNNVIRLNNINLDDDYYVIPNISILQLNGNTRTVDNYANRQLNSFKQRIRYSLMCGAIGISTSLLKKVSPYRTDIGYHADWLWSLELDFKCKKQYYTPFVAFTYRASVGVSHTTNKEAQGKSLVKTLTIIKSQFSNELDRKDKLYLNLVYRFEMYKASRNVSDYLIFLFLYVRNIRNIDSNNYIRNYKNIIPIPILLSLISLKSFIKRL